jgi:hypothetical protein
MYLKLLEMKENYHSLEYSILTVDSAAVVRIALLLIQSSKYNLKIERCIRIASGVAWNGFMPGSTYSGRH